MSDVRSVIPCVSSEQVMPDNVSHGRKRRRDELCHSVLLAQGLDHTDARVRKAMMSGKAESVAKLINSQSRAHRRDVCTLLDMLPSEPLSWQSDSGGKSFQVGSFVHEDVCGVRSMTRQFPETPKALCAYVKALFPGLEFGTVGLFRDLSALPHRDSNNEESVDSRWGDGVFQVFAFPFRQKVSASMESVPS